MATVQCQVDIPKVEGLKDQELTVGREFFLICKGEWPKDLIQEKLYLVFPEAQKYQIQLLGFEFRTTEEADLKVTSHKAVPVHFENLQISDGQQTVNLGKVDYQVQTVIERPQDPSQKVEAYGALGPASIPIPLVYVIAIALVVAGIGGWLTVRVYRYSQRRRLLAKLKEHDSALSPLNQYHQSMRRLHRDNTVFFGHHKTVEGHVLAAFEELSAMFYLFLTRELHVPAFDWSPSLILSNVKKYHSEVYQEMSLDLKKLLREYASAAKNKNSLSEKDIVVLSEQTRRLVERLDRVKQQGARS